MELLQLKIIPGWYYIVFHKLNEISNYLTEQLNT